MKVKDLMEILAKCNPNGNVYLGTEGYTNYDVQNDKYNENEDTKHKIYSDGSILLCDSGVYYPDDDWFKYNEVIREYYEVSDNSGVIHEKFDSEEEANEYAEKLFNDDIGLETEIDIYCVTEKLDVDGWHEIDNYTIGMYSKDL